LDEIINSKDFTIIIIIGELMKEIIIIDQSHIEKEVEVDMKDHEHVQEIETDLVRHPNQDKDHVQNHLIRILD
jgi:hypothetical protein